MPDQELRTQALPTDTIGLLEGITTTRAIRRYRDEAVPSEVLRAVLFAATRAPSGSNRQPFRFVVLTDGPKAREAKQLIGEAAREMWRVKRAKERYDDGSGALADSPKARLARTMQHYVDEFEQVPALIVPCVIPRTELMPEQRTVAEAPSIYPACQNLLLAARALGYGGVYTGFHFVVEKQLRALLDVPDEAFIVGVITLGKPVGRHGPVRRRPLGELVFGEHWGEAPDWAVDPPGTAFASAQPPSPALSLDKLDEIEQSLR